MKKKHTNTMGVARAALQVKQAGPADGLDEGTFVGYASVFGNVDSYGDIVEPGAFKDTLAAWEAKGDPIPLLWGHDMYDPFSNIGHVAKAEEDDRGLLIHGVFDLDNPTAQQVYRLVKGRRVTDMSFAYHVVEESKSADGNHLLKLDMLEVSIVPVGANRETDIMAVKSRLADAALKAGRVLSAANESRLQEAVDAIQAAADSIESVLSTVATDTIGVGTDKPSEPIAEGEASGTAEGKSNPTEEPSATARPVKGGNSDEDRKSIPSVEAYAAHIRFMALAAGKES